MGVVSLIPNNALAVNMAELADRIRMVADKVEAGEFDEVERAIILLDCTDGVARRVYGRQCNRAELVGLLEYAKARVIAGEDD